MGMFDYVDYEDKPCYNCGAMVGGWQSKDHDCELNTIEVTKVGNFYTSCDACNTWNEYTVEDGVISLSIGPRTNKRSTGALTSLCYVGLNKQAFMNEIKWNFVFKVVFGSETIICKVRCDEVLVEPDDIKNVIKNHNLGDVDERIITEFCNTLNAIDRNAETLRFMEEGFKNTVRSFIMKNPMKMERVCELIAELYVEKSMSE